MHLKYDSRVLKKRGCRERIIKLQLLFIYVNVEVGLSYSIQSFKHPNLMKTFKKKNKQKKSFHGAGVPCYL